MKSEVRDPTGNVVTAQLRIGDGVVMIGPGMEAFGTRAVTDPAWASTRMFVYVDDVDLHCERARAAGAHIVSEPAVHFSNNRIYVASDCGGQQWIFAEPVDDASTTGSFIPQVPADAALELLGRSVTHDHLVDEFIFQFTHTMQMDWLAPGIAATGRRLAVPHVAVIAFEGIKIASEHIYWDQASVLLQLGVLYDSVPVLGADQGDRLRNADAPANELITKFAERAADEPHT